MSEITIQSWADDDGKDEQWSVMRDGRTIAYHIKDKQDAIRMAAGLAGEGDVVIGTGDVFEDLGLNRDQALAEITKLGQEQELLDLIHRLSKRAEIRRQIPGRKSVEQGEPDRIANLLEEAAAMLKGFHRSHFQGELVDRLFAHIAHGDDDHRAWLYAELKKFFT